MIEILKIIGSALVTAAATLLALYLKRKWEKQDKTDDDKKTMEEKIDSLAVELAALSAKVDKLSTDLENEVTDTETESRGLRAGLRELLYDRIKMLCRKYLSEDKIREEDYKSLERMWNVYHEELQGNGFLDGEMQEVKKLEKY